MLGDPSPGFCFDLSPAGRRMTLKEVRFHTSAYMKATKKIRAIRRSQATDESCPPNHFMKSNHMPTAAA